MSVELLRQIESAAHDAANMARLAANAIERLGPSHRDHAGMEAAVFAADHAERMVRNVAAMVDHLCRERYPYATP